MLPILYSFRRCPYAMRARMAIILSSVECELREVLLKNKPQAMLKISPKGTVPVLQLQNRILDESMDIIDWALHQNSSRVHACSEHQSTLSNDWIALFDSKFKYHLDRYKYASRYKETLEDHQNECLHLLMELESSIESAPWVFGKTISLLDICILPFIRQTKIANPEWFQAQSFSKVIALLEHFESSALFTQAMKKFPLWNLDEPEIVLFPN